MKAVVQFGSDRESSARDLLSRTASGPPIDDDVQDGQAEDARLFRQVAWATAVIVTAVMPVIAIAQPGTMARALRNIVVVDALVLLTLWLAGRGRLRAAAWVHVLGFIALITFNAPPAGGIRSPGVPAYFIFVMMAGVLLGERAGIRTAILCATLGLGLVVAEALGLEPARPLEYNAVVRWLLTCLYMGVALLVMRVATGRVRAALAEARRELAVRRDTEERLDRALDAGRIGIFEYDVESERFRLDERGRALTGLSAGPDGRVPLDAWLQLVHPEDRGRIADDLERLVAGETRGHLQYRVVRSDGALRHVETVASARRGAAGGPTAILGMLVDVTDRLRAEAERERLVLQLGERIKELRLLHDVSRLLQHASGADRLLLAEVVARMPVAWLHAADACARVTFGEIDVASPDWAETPWIQTARFTTSDGEGMLQLAYRHEHPTADEGPFLAEERALIDSLAEMLRSHIERHVVERQRAAVEAQLRQAQKMEALGTLAGGIAHDFNNILAGIGGSAALASLDAPPDSAVAASIQEILKANARARDLVRRILMFSRRDASSQQVVDLAPVIDEALQLLRATLPRSIDVQFRAAPRLPVVRADATQMHQVMMNLGTNAAYAMRERGGTLSVALDAIAVESYGSALSPQLAPGRYLRLKVVDTGSGMSPEVRERLFEPFFSTKGTAGTGLGLAVVHGIVREHGGTIVVMSEPGRGTAFDIYLPAGEDVAVATPVQGSGVVRGAGQHVLWVDDEADICHLMTRMLVRLGYRCTGFTDPAVALHEFRATPKDFDAVVTDLQMPGMSGLDVARAVRAVRPDTPIAVASGYPAEHILTDPDARTVGWIFKPATLDELAASLHRLVNGSHSMP